MTPRKAKLANLEELAQAADGLMERPWQHLQYVPPPPSGTQMERDLAFRSQSTCALSSVVLPAAHNTALAMTGGTACLTFAALLDTGSSLSLLGMPFVMTAQASKSYTWQLDGRSAPRHSDIRFIGEAALDDNASFACLTCAASVSFGETSSLYPAFQCMWLFVDGLLAPRHNL